ncbi:WD40/YVTN/BNR-like repeat-containing protein [Stieleria varia]|uniref:BNR/Asp-box repeat protein n=1 Tax=Stieleria varia TaxID=2528005 RepID=A0A5C6B409_9BACT|nr:hypothetical protein [Stieleria varia]TWU06292.1 BNR/Asp-box repeat protein [Stieleria varia]
MAQEIKWKPLGLGGFGGMMTPAASRLVTGVDGERRPHLIINCDMGGVYISRDLGQTWQLFHYRQLRGNAAVKPAFAADYGLPGKPLQIYAGAAFGQMKVTHDGGRNWNFLGPERTVTNFELRLHGEIFVHSEDSSLLLVGASDDSEFFGYNLVDQKARCSNIELNKSVNKINRSIDGGATWQFVASWPDPTATAAIFHETLGFPLAFYFDRRAASEGKVIFAATQKKILVSEDRGATWGEFSIEGLPETETHEPLIRSFAGSSSPNGELRLYCTVKSFEHENRTIDGGVYLWHEDGPWKRLEKLENRRPTNSEDGCRLIQFHQVLTSDEMPELVYVVAANTGFDPMDLDEGVHSTLYRSTNAGLTWDRTFFPFPSHDGTTVVPYNVSNNWATVQKTALLQSQLGSPKPFVSEEPANDAAVSPDQTDVVVWVGTRSYVKQPGQPDNWLSTDSSLVKNGVPENAGPESGWICNGLVVTAVWHYHIDPHDSNRHFIAYTDCNYATSTDAGQSWTWGKYELAGEDSFWQNTVYEIAYDPKPNPTAGKHTRMWGAFASVHDIPNGNLILYHQPGLIDDPNLGTVKDSIGRVGFSEDGWTWTYHQLPGDGSTTKSVTSVSYSQSEAAIYATVFEDGIYRAKDELANDFQWERISDHFDAFPNRRFWRVTAHHDGTLFALITACTAKIGDSIDFDSRNQGVGVYRRAPNSADWQQIGQSVSPPFRWPRDMAVDSDDSNRVYLAVSEPLKNVNRLDGNVVPPEESGVYQWSVVDDTWRRLELNGISGEYRHFSVYIHPTQPDWIYILLEGEIGGLIREHSGLWLSRNGGKDCEAFKQFPFMNIHRVWISKDDPDTMYVCTNGASVWKGPADPVNEFPYHAVESDPPA